MPFRRRGARVRRENEDDPRASETLDDATLVIRARRNPQTFGVLYERYRPAVYRYCFRRLAAPDVAEDATQMIFMKAFSALHRFDPEPASGGASFRGWLFAIAHNVIVDTWRRDRHHVSLDTAWEDQSNERFSEYLVDPSMTLDELVLGAEEASAVQNLLMHLPDRQRSAVELRLSGLSTKEVAFVLGLSVSATKSLQFRAYKTVRDLLLTQSPPLIREVLR